MRKLFLVLFITPPIAFAEQSVYAPTDQQQRRFDSCLIACMQSYSKPEIGIWNDETHKEIEEKAIQCAYRMINRIHDIDEQISKAVRESNK